MPEKKATKKKVEKGDQYTCEVCGLSVIVDEDCECDDECDIICCGEQMKETKAKGRAAKSRA
jgi:hypothetical protein